MDAERLRRAAETCRGARAELFRHMHRSGELGPSVSPSSSMRALRAETKAKRHPDGRIPRAAKPDADNVAKAVLDAAQQAGVLHDDAQVAHIVVRSSYAARGEGPGVHVTMEVM